MRLQRLWMSPPTRTLSRTVSDVNSSSRWNVRAMPAPGPLVRRQPGDVVAVEQDAARVGPLEPGDDVEQRGLAGAVGADQAGDAARCRRSTVVSLSAVLPPKRTVTSRASSSASATAAHPFSAGDAEGGVEHLAVGDGERPADADELERQVGRVGAGQRARASSSAARRSAADRRLVTHVERHQHQSRDGDEPPVADRLVAGQEVGDRHDGDGADHHRHAARLQRCRGR